MVMGYPLIMSDGEGGTITLNQVGGWAVSVRQFAPNYKYAMEENRELSSTNCARRSESPLQDPKRITRGISKKGSRGKSSGTSQ